MIKQKSYDWKDSNIENIGSKENREIKNQSAKTEKAWRGSGQRVGTEVWRINNFKVERWPKEDYGKFFDGDSYIVLNTYKKNRESLDLLYDVHFWIGKHSTQDEYGTAAYKTVELDDYHNDKPVQHREVQGHESKLFKSYFETITIMNGGCESGFRRVDPKTYQPRLLHVIGERKKINVFEIPFKKGNLNSEDVFIVDVGLTIYQYNGKYANKDERFKAMQYIHQIKSDRKLKITAEIIEENEVRPNDPVMQYFKEGKSELKNEKIVPNKKAMYCLSDESGHMLFDEVSNGVLNQSVLDSQDVFILDTGFEIFVWIGSEASVEERKHAMTYAHQYLQDKNNPLCAITCLGEVQAKQSIEFNKLFDAQPC